MTFQRAHLHPQVTHKPCSCSGGNQTRSAHNNSRTFRRKLNMFYSSLFPLCFFLRENTVISLIKCWSLLFPCFSFHKLHRNWLGMDIVISFLLFLSTYLQFPLRVICSYLIPYPIQNSSNSNVSSFNHFPKIGKVVCLSFQKSHLLNTFNCVWSLEKSYIMEERKLASDI